MHILPYKRPLAALVTLIFLLSTNALLFASHAAEEMQVAFISPIAHQVASPENAHSADHHHAHNEEDVQGGGTPHPDCCSSHVPHSHALEDTSAPPLFPPLSAVSLTFYEPSFYLPEVFLDRFSPPQNRA